MMMSIYRGETVRIVRIEDRHAVIVWRGMLKRVNRRELEVP